MTKEELLEKVVSEKPQWRLEGTIVPPGLSLTRTERTEYWYWREGDSIYVLKLRRDEEPVFEVIHE